MKDWGWDRYATLAVSVVTLMVLLFGGVRGVATQADLAAVEERLTAAIESLRDEIRANNVRIDRHLEMHAAAGSAASTASPPD